MPLTGGQRQLLHKSSHGKSPYEDFFWKKSSISPMLGQSLEPPHHRAHMNFKKSKSSHSIAQSPHLRNFENSKSSHATAQSTYRWTLKTQSLYTPQHKAHTHGNCKNSKSSHNTTQNSHKWELWELKVLTRHNTTSTHSGALKNIKVFTDHNTEELWNLKVLSIERTHMEILKIQGLHIPRHRAHT